MRSIVVAALVVFAVAGCRQVLGLHDLHEVDAGEVADAPIDAPGPMVQLSGSVFEYDTGAGMAPANEVMLTFHRASDDKVLAMTMTKNSYMLTIPQGSDGYVHLHGPDTLDTNQYTNSPLMADSPESLFIYSRTFVNKLAADGAVGQGLSNGLVMFIVETAGLSGIAGATVSSSAGGTIRYLGPSGVDPAAVMTDASGEAYIFNATLGVTTFTATHGPDVTRDARVTGGALTVIPMISQ